MDPAADPVDPVLINNDDQDDESLGIIINGLNFTELLNGGTEFQVDMESNGDLKKIEDPLLYEQGDQGFENEDVTEHTTNDIIKSMERSLETKLLDCPEYHDFKELAAKMIDCLPSGEVKILIINEGDGPLVPSDAVVTVHYNAYWEKEEIPFDTTLTMNYGNPVKFRLGSKSILPGLEMGLSMVKGPTARFCLLLHPRVTWGAMGVLPRIRPEQSLFMVSLLDVQDIGAINRFNSLPSEEQRKFEVTLRTVSASNEEAKRKFLKKRYTDSTRHYLKSISVMQLCHPETEDEVGQLKALLSKVYMNLAVCYTRLDRPQKVLRMCDELGRVVETKGHSKCQYYYGRAFQMLGQYEDAMKYYVRALQLEPTNVDVGNAISALQAIVEKARLAEKSLWANALSGGSATVRFDSVDDSVKDDVERICDYLNDKQVPSFTRCNFAFGLMKCELEYVRHYLQRHKNLMLVEENKNDKPAYAIMKK